MSKKFPKIVDMSAFVKKNNGFFYACGWQYKYKRSQDYRLNLQQVDMISTHKFKISINERPLEMVRRGDLFGWNLMRLRLGLLCRFSRLRLCIAGIKTNNSWISITRFHCHVIYLDRLETNKKCKFIQVFVKTIKLKICIDCNAYL